MVRRVWFALLFWGVLGLACGGAANPLMTDKDGAAIVPEEDGQAGDDGSMMSPDDAGPDARKDANGVIDSGPPVKCENVCPMNGGTCVNGTCVIDCGYGAYACGTKIFCPKGVPCKVLCNGAYSCGQGVDCSQATSCDITCGGSYSCAQAVSCGGTQCTTSCTMSNACAQGINCTATTCTLNCNGFQSCGAGKVNCNGTTCGVNCGFQACGGGVCCTAKTCNVMGAPNGC